MFDLKNEKRHNLEEHDIKNFIKNGKTDNVIVVEMLNFN